MKKNDIIEYKKWSYKVIKTLGNIVHVRPLNGNGRVRMHSPTTTLINENGVLKEFNIFSNEPVKKENTTPTTEGKEGLHTQGEWKTEYQQYGDEQDSTNSHICVAASNGDWIADCGLEGNEQAEANAELIVKAVNERQALLNSNRELKKIIEYIGRNATKINEHTWSVYKEQIIAHVNDAESIQ